MKIRPNKFMGFHGVSWIFIGHSTSAFFCSLSEAQKGAENKVQIKAQLGGLPVTQASIRYKCGSKNSWYLPGISL